MIENDKQLENIKNQLGRLLNNYSAHSKIKLRNPRISILHKAQLDGMKSIIEELEQQIGDYNETIS